MTDLLEQLIEQDAKIEELEAENARLREAVRKAFQEYAEDQGECIGCGWPASKLQQKHGDGCFIGAALQEGSDD